MTKLTEKLSKDIEYANKYFPDYKKHFLLWSPIVKYSGIDTKHDQMRDVREIRDKIKSKYHIEIEFVMNEKFSACLEELRKYAAEETKELESIILRYMQIESYLDKHLKKITRKQISGDTKL